MHKYTNSQVSTNTSRLSRKSSRESFADRYGSIRSTPIHFRDFHIYIYIYIARVTSQKYFKSNNCLREKRQLSKRFKWNNIYYSTNNKINRQANNIESPSLTRCVSRGPSGPFNKSLTSFYPTKFSLQVPKTKTERGFKIMNKIIGIYARATPIRQTISPGRMKSILGTPKLDRHSNEQKNVITQKYWEPIKKRRYIDDGIENK